MYMYMEVGVREDIFNPSGIRTPSLGVIISSTQ